MRAIFEGMRFSLRMGVALLVESDCLMAMKFIKNSSVEAEVARIRELKSFFEVVDFSFIPRQCNKVADSLAKYARSSKVSEFWEGQYPSWLCNEVHLDNQFFAQVA